MHNINGGKVEDCKKGHRFFALLFIVPESRIAYSTEDRGTPITGLTLGPRYGA